MFNLPRQCVSGTDLLRHLHVVLTEIKVVDQTCYLTQSQYTDTGPTSPSADLVTPDARQGIHWSTNSEVSGVTRPGNKAPRGGRGSNSGLPLSSWTLTTGLPRWITQGGKKKKKKKEGGEGEGGREDGGGGRAAGWRLCPGW